MANTFSAANSIARAEAWGNATPTNSNQAFIPELWSDEIVAAYRSNLVVANLVTKMNHVGKKGDTVHIPFPTRSTASSKTANQAVTLLRNDETKVQVNIDKHFEYSRLIEDLVDVQALPSLRRFYTEDAGYALARMVDWHLHVVATAWNNGTEDTTGIDTPAGALTYTAAYIGSDGATLWAPTGNGNGTALTDAGIRRLIQRIDDNDVPMSDRYIVIPPVEKKNLTGIARFTETQFVGEVGGGNTIRNGLVGDIYGHQVFVSTNCATPVDTGGTNSFRAGLIFHKSASVLVEQMGVRSQVQYKQEFLSDLLTSDTIYGVKVVRTGASNHPASAGFVFVVPA